MTKINKTTEFTLSNDEILAALSEERIAILKEANDMDNELAEARKHGAVISAKINEISYKKQAIEQRLDDIDQEIYGRIRNAKESSGDED